MLCSVKMLIYHVILRLAAGEILYELISGPIVKIEYTKQTRFRNRNALPKSKITTTTYGENIALTCGEHSYLVLARLGAFDR